MAGVDGFTGAGFVGFGFEGMGGKLLGEVVCDNAKEPKNRVKPIQ